MDDVDDDFGDLYADVEVEASSAINKVPAFSQLQFGSDENGEQNKNQLEGPKTGEAEAVDGGSDDDDGEEEEEEEEDDDDDDLNIVLNSDDGQEKGFSIAGNANLRSGGGLGLGDEDDDDEGREGGGGELAEGSGGGLGKNGLAFGDRIDNQSLNGKAGYNSQNSQYKYVRSQSAAYASNLKGNGCGAVASFSYSSLRGNQEDNGFSQRKGSGSMGPQSGHSFSLPRSRTIMDVNIDIFEQKPWKQPEADITDYFNFGLNEDSWKLYCNQVDEYRHRGPMSNRKLTSGHIQVTEAYEGGAALEMVGEGVGGKTKSRHWIAVSSIPRIPCGEQQPERNKGRAIQVEDSIVERQSSMDVVHQLHRDSDVIQIIGQDQGEPCSSSVKEGTNHKDSSAPETSENKDVGVDDGTNSLCFSSASEDELRSKSPEGSHEVMGIHASKRSSRQRSSNKPLTKGFQNHGSHQISDVDDHHHSRVAICRSEGTDETIGTSNNSKERIGDDTCTTDPSMLEAESSKAEKSTASHCKAFDNGSYIDRRESNSLERRPSAKSLTEWSQSVKYDYRHSKDCKTPNDKRKSSDSRYYARHSSPVYSSRRSTGDYKPKPHLEKEGFFPMSSDAEGIYDVHLSAVGRNRRNERQHAFDSYNGEDRSYSKESEVPSDYYGERFCDYEVEDALKRNPHQKGYESFGVKTDPYVFSSLDEEEYYHERRRHLKDGVVIERDWYHNERDLGFDYMDSFPCQEFGRLNSKHPPYLKYKRGAQWKRKVDNLHFGNRGRDGDFFLENEEADDMRRGKYKRSLTYDVRDRDHLEQKYIRHFQHTRREVRSPGRIKRTFGSPSVGLDNFRLKGDADRYLRYEESRSFASRSFKEPHYINGSRWRGSMRSRNNVYERGGRYRGHWNERFRDNSSYCNYSDPFDREENAADTDDRLNVERRRHHEKSEIQCDEEKTMSRHGDSKFSSQGVSFPLGRRHKRFDAEHGSNHVDKLIDDLHVEGRRHKMRRGVNSSDKFDKVSNVIREGSHEQPFREFRESLDSHLVDRSDHVEVLIDDPQAEEHRCKQTGEVNSGSKFDRTLNVIRGESGEQPPLGCVESLDSHLLDGAELLDELIDAPYAEGHRDKQRREVEGGNKFGRTSNIVYGESHEQLSLSGGNSLDSHLVVGGGKSSGEYYETHDKTEWSIDELEKRTRTDFDSCLDEKVVQPVETNVIDEDWLDKFEIPEEAEGWDIEEGQILTEEVNLRPMSDIYAPDAEAHVNDVHELHHQNGKVGFQEGFDNPRILEVMAKMEKRRERFKEPITMRKDTDNATKLTVVDSVEEASTRHQRPARKRRWGGS